MRSVGYSDLFVLSKTDMWDVLKDYPAARSNIMLTNANANANTNKNTNTTVREHLL